MNDRVRRYAPPHVFRQPSAWLSPKTKSPGQYPNWNESVGLLLRIAPQFLDPEGLRDAEETTARGQFAPGVEVSFEEMMHCLRLLLSNPERHEALVTGAGEAIRIVLTDFLATVTAVEKQQGHYPPPELRD